MREICGNVLISARYAGVDIATVEHPCMDQEQAEIAARESITGKARTVARDHRWSWEDVEDFAGDCVLGWLKYFRSPKYDHNKQPHHQQASEWLYVRRRAIDRIRTGKTKLSALSIDAMERDHDYEIPDPRPPAPWRTLAHILDDIQLPRPSKRPCAEDMEYLADELDECGYEYGQGESTESRDVA